MTQTAPTPPQDPRSTKADMVRKLLCARHGASLDELVSATGWKPHSCRAFLTGLRKKGDVIVRAQRKDGTSFYRIGKAAVSAATDQASDAIEVTTSAGAA